MKKSAYILAILLLFTLWACDSYDSWTVDPSARLTFSSDTVSFDTVISRVGSSTQRLLVFNHNKAGIRIANVRLKHGADSHFRINVDGQFLEQGSGYDYEVRGQDSIFVLIEVTLPDADADTVTPSTDSLAFQTESGEIQYVTLLAGGRDAYHWYGTVEIDQDRTIQAGRPIVIYDSVHVASQATLTLAPGTVLMFHHNASMRIDGKLVANGTIDNPVIMRGDRTDNLFSYLPYDNTPEQWGGLYLYGGPHMLDYLDLHASKFGIVAEDCSIQLNNCILRNSRGNGLTTRNCILTAVNTEISNSMGDLYSMTGGSTDMIHCTLAQYYNYDSQHGMALRLSDFTYEYGDTMYYALRKAWFRNCVITIRMSSWAVSWARRSLASTSTTSSATAICAPTRYSRGTTPNASSAIYSRAPTPFRAVPTTYCSTHTNAATTLPPTHLAVSAEMPKKSCPSNIRSTVSVTAVQETTNPTSEHIS